MEHISVFELSFNYLNSFYQVEPDPLIKFNTIVTFKKALNMGWTAEGIIRELQNYRGNGIPDIESMFSRFNNKEDRNLITDGNTFFYHNLLRCCPAPPTVAWDINTGMIETVPQEEYYIEMRASITATQIVDYYVLQLGIDSKDVNMNRYKGSMTYLVDKYGLDLTLFMIDVTRNLIFSEHLPKPTTPMEVAENAYHAKELLEQKISENRAAEDDKIVYKRRIFNNRSGCQT